MSGRREKPKRSLKSVHLVVVDGHTEKWYLDLFKEKEGLKNFKVDPDLCKQKSLEEQYQTILENVDTYQSVIWLVDLDVIVKETKEAKKGKKTKIALLKGYLESLKQYGQVHVLVNMPCLEFWYLLHFKHTGKYFASYDEVKDAFADTPLADYEKTEKYYKKPSHNIYSKLEPLQEKAFERAEKLGDFDIENYETGKAEMYKLLRLLKGE